MVVSRVRRAGLAATVCLLAVAGLAGVFGSVRPAVAIVGGIMVPANGTFDPNNTNGTFTYTYLPIAVAPEVGVIDEPETPTCTAFNVSGVPIGSVGLTSFTFNQGTTNVHCTAPEDDASPDNAPDTGMFQVIVRESGLSFTNPLLDQTKTADATDTATFTVPAVVTANEPLETAAESFSISACNTTVSGQPPLTYPITLSTAPPLGPRYQYFCMATDTTDNSLHPSLVLVTLTVQDERTFLSNPGAQTATADATDTALVSYPTVTPSELPSGELDGQAAGCTADNGATSNDFFASSGTFQIGVTNVSCNANDIPNAPNKDGTPPVESAPQINFTVTVTDQPFTLAVPPDQNVPATGPGGATVTYAPGPVTAIEGSEAETIPITCSVDNGATSGDGFVSGGDFLIGDTTVTCSATDPDGFSAGPTSFTVHVQGAGKQIGNLINLVDSFNLGHGPQNSLDKKLQHVLDAVNGADTETGCNLLGAFMNEVEAQSGKKLTVDQANRLLVAAARVQAVLVC
jgi:hypothetical protein